MIEARARGELPDARYEALADFTRAVIASRGAVTDEQFEAFPRRRFRPGPGPGSDPRVSLATCNFANVFARTPLNAEPEQYRWTNPQA